MTVRRVLLLLVALGVAAPIPSDPSPCQLGEERRGGGDGDVDSDSDADTDTDTDVDSDSDSDSDIDGDGDGDTDVDSDADGDGDASACTLCVDNTQFDNAGCTTPCAGASDCNWCSPGCECVSVHDYRANREVSVCGTGGEPPYLMPSSGCSADSECASNPDYPCR